MPLVPYIKVICQSISGCLSHSHASFNSSVFFLLIWLIYHLNSIKFNRDKKCCRKFFQTSSVFSIWTRDWPSFDTNFCSFNFDCRVILVQLLAGSRCDSRTSSIIGNKHVNSRYNVYRSESDIPAVAYVKVSFYLNNLMY